MRSLPPRSQKNKKKFYLKFSKLKKNTFEIFKKFHLKNLKYYLLNILAFECNYYSKKNAFFLNRFYRKNSVALIFNKKMFFKENSYYWSD
jgi:hypothetical protein